MVYSMFQVLNILSLMPNLTIFHRNNVSNETMQHLRIGLIHYK